MRRRLPPPSSPFRLSPLPRAAGAPTPGRLVSAVAAGLAGSVVAEPGTQHAEPAQGWTPRAPLERRRGRRRRRYNRHLRDGLTRTQRISLACFILAWGALTLAAWLWWLAPGHAGSVVGMGVNTGLLALESLFLPAWFFSWLWRMRRPDPALGVPDLRTAMVVTKAPSEPWEVVRETLEAMLAQDFPAAYDVWLADESPDAETYRWCEQHGVLVSTRAGVEAYHQPAWPRRTRCKEGNLAYFYDHWGYDLYDVVAQLDADHVPASDYLRRMVVPFTDPHVGYVAAPSICDRNAEHSWSARARLYAEAVLHGPMQAGHSGGCAPSCIGSHYAVRTAALRQIGGLGPELAEDFTTSLMMSSSGWQGVFAIDAEAHGDGPATVADCMTQEFQWSRSMMNVLLGINGRYWHGLSRRVKFRLGFCQLWYPLFAVMMLASVTLPLVAIATRTPLARVSLGSFWLHFGPPTAVLLLVVLWLRSLHWLRPRNAKALSWEIVLFQLVRWPWVLFGCVHAVAGRLAGREFSFKVTPKGRSGPQPLPLRMVVPYLIIAGAAAAPAVLGVRAGRAGGYYTLDFVNLFLYLAAAIAIVVLHVRDHPRGMRFTALRRSWSKLTATLLAAGAMAGATAVSASAVWPVMAERAHAGGHHSRGPQGPDLTPLSRADQHRAFAVGVTTWSLTIDSTTPWRPQDLRQVAAFERLVHTPVSIVMWYADWAHAPLQLSQLRAVGRLGRVPEITWEPWDYLRGKNQPRYTLASIISGRHDAYIRRWARTLHAYGHPVLMRFAQEMNGNWYPWDEGVNGNRRGDFARAWRHVYRIFALAHATNVRWVWSPVARGGFPLSIRQYPGSRYVDIIGLSGFNAGTSARGWGGWRSFATIFGHSLTTVARLAPGKPVQISEVSSVARAGAQAGWIAAMFRYLRTHREITSLLWFDITKQADWRLTSRRSGTAFADGVRAVLASRR